MRKLIYIDSKIYVEKNIDQYKTSSDCILCDVREDTARTTAIITWCPAEYYDDLPDIFKEIQKKFKQSIYIKKHEDVDTIKDFEGTVLQLNQDRIKRLAEEFKLADKELADKIQDIKEKKELLDLELVDNDEWVAKKAEYTPLKSKYKTAKDKKNKYIV